MADQWQEGILPQQNSNNQWQEGILPQTPAPAVTPATPAAPAQPSFMERVKNAVTPGPDTLQNTVIGIGAGMYKVGKGAQQLISEAGSHIPFIPEHMRQEAAQRAETAKKERESAISDFEPLRSTSTAAKVGEFVGEMAPTMVIPGGVTGGALKRAGTAALAGAGIGAIMEPEAPVTGAAKGAAFGAAGSGITSLAGKAVNALTGNVPQTAIEDLADKWAPGLKKYLTLNEATKGAASKTDVMMERAPGMFGTQKFRAQGQDAAHGAAKQFFGKYVVGGDITDPDASQINREFVSDLYEGVKGLVTQVPQQLQSFTPTETQKAAKDLLTQFSGIFKTFQDTNLEKKIMDIESGAAKNITFDDAWQLRKGLGTMIGQARKQELSGLVNKEAVTKVKTLFGAVSDDIDKWADSIGQPQISEQFKTANEAYRTFVVKHDILSRVYDKVTKMQGENKYISPQKFSNELYTTIKRNKYTKTFNPGEVAEMTGLMNIMQVVKRSGQFMENQPTANRWGPAALGLGMEGTAYQVAGMTGALKTAGVAAIVTGAVKLLTTTTIGKRLAMAASKYNPQGRAMARIVNEIYSLVPKAAAVGGEQATAPAPTPEGRMESGDIPGKVIPGQGDVTETPTEPGEYITGVDAIIAKGRELSPGQNLTDLDAHAVGKQWYDQETTRLKQLAGNMTPVNNSGVNIGFKESGMVRKEKNHAFSKRETSASFRDGKSQPGNVKEIKHSNESGKGFQQSRYGNETSVKGGKKQSGSQGEETEKGDSRSLTLVPAVRKNGKIYTGGKDHDSIIKAKFLGLKATNNERGFLDPSGKFLDREQAIKYLEKAKPELFKTLKAEGINELRSNDLKKTVRVSSKQKMLDEDL